MSFARGRQCSTIFQPGEVVRGSREPKFGHRQRFHTARRDGTTRPPADLFPSGGKAQSPKVSRSSRCYVIEYYHLLMSVGALDSGPAQRNNTLRKRDSCKMSQSLRGSWDTSPKRSSGKGPCALQGKSRRNHVLRRETPLRRRETSPLWKGSMPRPQMTPLKVGKLSDKWARGPWFTSVYFMKYIPPIYILLK